MTYGFTGRWSDTTRYNSNLYPDREKKAKHSMLERANERARQVMPLLKKEYIWALLQGKQEAPAERARHLRELGIPLQAERPAGPGGHVEGIVHAAG
ncbi:hypothetical protein ABU162_20575 [Paenibacillus thiaminolyticus]|uniref:hypothetical protein n=1 Tax=Paenibacillus thiaminolyticus TaxID=49283 RepID=UPI0035A59695